MISAWYVAPAQRCTQDEAPGALTFTSNCNLLLCLQSAGQLGVLLRLVRC